MQFRPYEMRAPQPTISPFGMAALFRTGGEQLGRGFNALAQGAAQDRERERQSAIAALFGQMSAPKGQDIGDWAKGATARLMGVGATPKEALGLIEGIAKPALADRKLQEQRRAAEAMEALRGQQLSQDYQRMGTKTVSSPVTGEVRRYNPASDSFETIMEGQTTASGGVPTKQIEMKTVTVKDGMGNEVSRVVPVNKSTGNIVVNGVDSGQPAVSIKNPTISQQDKDSALATTKSLELLGEAKQLYTPDIVGPMDNTLAWLANATGTAREGGDAQRNRELNQVLQNLKANLVAALIKGVPSDRDLKIIEEMLPSTSDSEPVFKQKLRRIEEILQRQAKADERVLGMRGQQRAADSRKRTYSKSGKPIYQDEKGVWRYEK